MERSNSGNLDRPSPHISDGLAKSKYKLFYQRLYNCLSYLEMENIKLIEAIQNKSNVTTNIKYLDELIDEFAFKVANKKDTYDRNLVEQAITEGQQAFMAKKWKMRYHNLMDLGLLIEKLLLKLCADEKASDNNEKYDRNVSEKISQETKNLTAFLNEILNVPWNKSVNNDMNHQDNTNSDSSKHIFVNDVIYNENDSGFRNQSNYEFDDFTIPISSVFIQDLLANHNLCAEEIKRHNEIKCHLFHLLKKTKEQRNQLKKYVTEQEHEIQTLNKSIFDTENLIINSKLNTQSSTGKLHDNTKKLLFNKNKLRNLEINLDLNDESNDLENEIKLLEYHKRELESVLKEEEQQRRQLSKKLEQLVGIIHVICCIKPDPENYVQIISDDKILLPKSIESIRSKKCLTTTTVAANSSGSSSSCSSSSSSISSSSGNLDTNPMRCFIFEKVFGPDVEHYVLFEKFNESIKECLNGHNLGILIYGSHNSGKTYTMFGNQVDECDGKTDQNSNNGIAQNTINELLALIKQRNEWNYKLHTNVLCITDDYVKDLLKDNKFVFSNTTQNKVDIDNNENTNLKNENISFHNNNNNNQYSNFKDIEIITSNDFNDLIKLIYKNHFQKNKMQSEHLLFQIQIEGAKKQSKNISTKSVIILCELGYWEKNFNSNECDLISNEELQITTNSDLLTTTITNTTASTTITTTTTTATTTTATPTNTTIVNDFLSENLMNKKIINPLRTNIHQSLISLTKIFTNLRRHKLPTFNNSHLTRLLKPILIGSSKCYLILTLDPNPDKFKSTLNSLLFAQNAMHVPTKLSTTNNTTNNSNNNSCKNCQGIYHNNKNDDYNI